MTSIQMMAGVNLFSCLLTSVSLLQQGVFYSSLLFMSQFPKYVFLPFVVSTVGSYSVLRIRDVYPGSEFFPS
jgi:adenosine 3'-phospho 5'-phosphosulfate transporter B2